MAKKIIDGPIISPKLDFNDAEKQAKQFKKKLEDEIGSSGSSAKALKLDIDSKKALDGLDDIFDKIDDIRSHPIQLDVETQEYKDAVAEVSRLEEVQAEFERANEEALRNGAENYANAQAEADRLTKVIARLGEEAERTQSYIENELSQYDYNVKMGDSDLAAGNIEAASRYQDALDGVNENIAQANAELQRQRQIIETTGPVIKKNGELLDDVAKAEEKVTQLAKDGKRFETGEDKKALEEVNKELQDQINKLKLLDVKRKEMNTPKGGSVEGKGDAIGGLGSSLAGATKGVSLVVAGVLKTLKKVLLPLAAITLGVRGLMGLVNKLRGMIKEGFKAIYDGDKEFKKQIDDLKNSFDEVKANLAAAFMPIIEIAIPYIQQLLNWVNMLISKLAMFVAAIAGQNEYTKAIKKTGDAAAGASKQLSKFDELNNLSSNGGSAYDISKQAIDPEVLDKVAKLKELLNEIKEAMIDFAKENIFEPFKKGFNEAIGDWRGKIDNIKENFLSIKDSLVEIFTDPEVQAAQLKYIQSFSHFAGTLVGLAANIGLNIGQAITGGIAKFLEEHKDEIKDDLANIFTIGSDILDNFSSLAVSLSQIVDTIGESDALQTTISNLLGTVYELYSALELVALKLIEISSGTVAQTVSENVENIKGGLEGVFQVLAKVSEFLQMVATTIKDVLLRLVDEAIKPLFEYLQPILSEVIAVILQLWSIIQPLLTYLMDEIMELWQGYLAPVLDGAVDLIVAVASLVGEVITALWKNAIKPVVDFVIAWLPIILESFQFTFDAIVLMIKIMMISFESLFKGVADIVKLFVALIRGDWKGAWEAAKSFVVDMFIEPVKKVWSTLSTYFEKQFDHFKELLSNLLKALVKTGEVIVNTLSNLINEGLIKILNGTTAALNLIPGVDIPEIPNIPEVNWSASIPALAQGTVIPPSMGDFIARLGDNNREAEVVSPLSTIKEALSQALQESGGFGGDINVELTVDGNTLARTVVKQNELYKRQTGRSLLTI